MTLVKHSLSDAATDDHAEKTEVSETSGQELQGKDTHNLGHKVLREG